MVEVRLSFGKPSGPKCIHWLSWLWSWSWWLAYATNGRYSHLDIVLPPDALTASQEEDVVLGLMRLNPNRPMVYPLLIGSTIIPGVDLKGNVVKSGVAIRDSDYQDNKRTLIATYPNAPSDATWLLRMVGRPFWWGAIWRFARPMWMRRPVPDMLLDETAFCSELFFQWQRVQGYAVCNPEHPIPDLTPDDALDPPPPICVYKNSDEVTYD